ncbi:hypothetical protein BDR05DRAFT_853324, partial [Suillus weaverae]
MMADYGMDVDALPYTAPPGDEGLDMSHEGGEYEAFEELAHEVAGISGCRYIDPHTHTDHIENKSHHWDIQIDLLVEAYLDYCHRNLGDDIPQVNEIPLSPSDYDDQHISLGQIEFIDIFRRSSSSPRSQPHHQYPNETLIYH